MPLPPDPAEIAGRYEVIARLGAGGYGTVYKAKDRLLGRLVAIKVLRNELLRGGSAFARFEVEGKALAGLNHPNIVTVYDMRRDKDGVSYLAMELIEGVALDVLLVRERRLPWQRAVLIAAQIGDALAFAHERRVVHRDLKPANVMLEAGDRVKVTDFGIAKIPESTKLTMTGSIVGTPGYMSPEQAQADEVDGRSDIFALGCVLYEMITGERAFSGDSLTVVIYKILHDDPPAIRALEPGLPAEVVDLVNRALGKHPDARPDAKAFSSALRKLGASVDTMVPALERTQNTVLVPGDPPRSPKTPGTLLIPPLPPPPDPAPAPPRVAARPPVGPPPRAVPTTPAPAPPAPWDDTPPSPKRSPLVSAAIGCVVLLGIGVFGAGGAYLYLRPTGSKESPSATPSPERETPSPAAMAPDSLQPSQSPNPVPSAPASSPLAASPAPALSASPAPSPARTTVPARPQESPQKTPPPTLAASPRPEASPLVTPRPTPVPRVEPSPLPATPRPEPSRKSTGNEGRQVAGDFRKGGPTGNFGASGHLRPRDKDPTDLTAIEAPAVSQLRAIVDAELAHYRRTSRYGSLTELVRGNHLTLGPHSPTQLEAHRYRFELKVRGDAFTVTASPVSAAARSFVGDESGFIVANP